MDSYDAYNRSPRGGDSYRADRTERRDRDRDRRRSRSPAPIDRYLPDRAPRDDSYRRDRDDRRDRDRRRQSPPAIDRYVPGQDPPTPAILVNPLPHPLKLDFQVGFTWFAEWWRTQQRIKEDKERQRTGKPPARRERRDEREAKEEREAERSKIQLAYDQYKENLQKQQAQTFVRLHKKEDWFQERYVPEVRKPFRQALMDYRKGLFAKWEQDLNSGVFDDFTLEGIYKTESNGAGGIVEKEEGETTAAAEVLGVGDLVPSIGGDLRDPIAQQPTLLIKTIAPTVSRTKFQEFAKEHLGEGPGGFFHLSLSDPNPLKKCHRMGWIMLGPETENGAEQPPQEDSLKLQEDFIKMDDIDTKPQGQKTSERALEKINGKTIEDPERGNFTVHCGVHRPPEAPRKKALWDLFSAPERVARDVELATRLVRKLDNELGDEAFGVAKIEQRVEALAESGALKPPTPPKRGQDMDTEEGEADEGMIVDDETDDEELLLKKKKLDLLVEYLRRVYSFCFFCVFESDSVHELQRKCPGGHLRRPRSSLTSAAKETARASALGEEFPLKKKEGRGDGDEGDMLDADDSPADERKPSLKPSTKNTQQLQRAFNWVKTFEEKILQIIEPENVNLRKLGGTPVEEGLEEELINYVKQEDVNKYRCKVPECTKLFKGVDFWRKHVEKRHVEWYDGLRQDIELVNTYCVDPAHIAPSRSDANSNGHFPLNNHQPTGTPRGFQLNQQFASNLPPGITAGMFTGGGGWGSNGIGPMRSHGRNNINRAPGPYARNDGRGRLGSRGGGGPGMEGGAGAMGPREAVQGRSLRSYEDLDADKDKGPTELNY